MNLSILVVLVTVNLAIALLGVYLPCAAHVAI
jgi:hypothetical protein